MMKTGEEVMECDKVSRSGGGAKDGTGENEGFTTGGQRNGGSVILLAGKKQGHRGLAYGDCDFKFSGNRNLNYKGPN